MSVRLGRAGKAACLQMWVRRPVSATSRGALGLLYRLGLAAGFLCLGCSGSSLLRAGSLAAESRAPPCPGSCRGARLSVPGLQHLQRASSVVSAHWL